MTVKLHGLYDETRREELAMALIPVVAGHSRTIDMTDVEHIDIGALHSLLPLLRPEMSAPTPPVDLIGMNDDVHRSLIRAGFAMFFRRV
jgi:hypothetical protein